MAAFLSSLSVATAATILALLLLAPQLSAYVIRIGLRSVGWVIEKRSKLKREVILIRAATEEGRYYHSASHSDKEHSGAEEDDDWEHIEDRGVAQKISRKNNAKDDWEGVVGFFHPFCNAGGGGERVLWAAIQATQKRWPKAVCAVYTGDRGVDKPTILMNVETRFNIKLHAPKITFIYLSTRKYVLSSTYPRFTLLAQSLGSLILAHDAFSQLVPDILIDTMGYSFALAFSHFLFPSVPTAGYIHYPTISTDMLQSLDDATGQSGLNAGAGKGWRGSIKRRYWHLFAKLYGWVGGTVDIVMCNSSWTAGHINSLWLPIRRQMKKIFPNASVVFPPVAVAELESSIKVDLGSEAELREPTILYIAQFRPEKNHPLVLRAFAQLLKRRSNSNNNIDKENNTENLSNSATSTALDAAPPLTGTASVIPPQPKLVLIGSIRQPSPDETHIYNLRLLAHELRIRNQTTFLCNASWLVVLEHLRRASIGVNAMWNEHFGIGVVEYQAAGLLPVVHDSGGPKLDIVVDLTGPESTSGSEAPKKPVGPDAANDGDGDESYGATGFHAATEEEFADAFEAALALPVPDRVAMRLRARRSARRFTEEEFDSKWIAEMEKLVKLRRERT